VNSAEPKSGGNAKMRNGFIRMVVGSENTQPRYSKGCANPNTKVLSNFIQTTYEVFIFRISH